MDVVFLIIILFIRETEREREAEKLCRERSSLPTRSPVWDSIPDSRITP